MHRGLVLGPGPGKRVLPNVSPAVATGAIGEARVIHNIARFARSLPLATTPTLFFTMDEGVSCILPPRGRRTDDMRPRSGP